MLKYAVLILRRKKGVPANFYVFCISGHMSLILQVVPPSEGALCSLDICSCNPAYSFSQPPLLQVSCACSATKVNLLKDLNLFFAYFGEFVAIWVFLL